MRQDTGISYSDLERLGWPNDLVNDYQGMKREFTPQYGIETNPNGIYVANLNRTYFDTATPGMWFNPTPGANTGWIQIV